MENYDIVVVGGGPAGANFARMASAKYRILLIDGGNGREKVCGGLLSPSAQKKLNEYGIEVPGSVLAFPQIKTVRVADLPSRIERNYPRDYINVVRERFDRYLLGLLPSNVTVKSGRVKELTPDGDAFSVVLHSGETYSCRYLVGADGASSVVRRTFFPEVKIERYTAIQQWFDAKDLEPYYACVFDRPTSPACSWVFFKDGRVAFGGAFSPVGSRQAFDAQKRKLIEKGWLPDAEPLYTEACEVSRPHFFRGLALGGGRVFLIGEAAGFISASSFEGISFALSSGQALAEAFSSADIMSAYRKKTAPLRRKVRRRCVKRFFLFTPWIRRLGMRSGITSVR